MARYGRAAAKTVKSAMRRRKNGTLRSGKGGKGGVVKNRKAGDRHRSVGGAEEGRKGSPQTLPLIAAFSVSTGKALYGDT